MNTDENKQIFCFLICNDRKERIPITKSPFIIGSKPDVCDYVVLDNKYVGRNHAHIIVQDNDCYFVDNNSTNKSYINGKQIAPKQKIMLANGDEIRLANLSFGFLKS